MNWESVLRQFSEWVRKEKFGISDEVMVKFGITKMHKGGTEMHGGSNGES